MVTGAAMIALERARQVFSEGYSAEHDDRHKRYQLVDAGICYAREATLAARPSSVPLTWPWEDELWKPSERIDDLVKAGALFAAEIDRLLRAGYTHGRPVADDSDG